MKEKINPQGLKLFISSFLILLAVFSLITVFGFFGLTQFNQHLLQDSRQKQEVLNVLRELRMNFVSEHNAITYGISKGMSQSTAIYQDAEKKLQDCFTRLRNFLNDRNSLAKLDSLISCQTLFSEQISRLFSSLQSAGGQSLTYDELTDIKSYRLKTLNEANAYAENFDKNLNELETATAAEYNHFLTTIITSLKRMKSYFLVLGAVLFVLTAVFSFMFARRATEPMAATSGLIREMVRSNYSMNIDYSKIDNGDVKDILRTFSTAVSTFKTFIMRITESIDDLSKAKTSVHEGIDRLKKTEEEKKDLNSQTSTALLGYARDFEDTSFYFKRIREQVNGMQDIKDSVNKALSAMAEKTVHLIESQNRCISQLYTFNETAERINLLAVNINLEASKSGGDSHGFPSMTVEIRRLVGQALESNRNFGRLITENKNSIAGFRENIQNSLREISGMESHFEEIGTENSQIQRIMDASTRIQKEIMDRDRKLGALKSETLGLLNGFERTNIQLEDDLRKLSAECGEYSDLKEEINYTRVNNPDELAEKAAFGDSEKS